MELTMNMRLDTDDCLSFSGQSMGYPPSLSAASSHDPFTPTSGRATPVSRVSASELEASFATMENLSFATPPPSATASAYYPVDMRHQPISDFGHDAGVSCILPRDYHSQVDYGFHSNGLVPYQLAPPRSMCFYNAADGNSPQHFIPAGDASSHGSVISDGPSIWAESLSPENIFDNQGSGLRPMPSRKESESRRRPRVTEIRHRTTVLQRAEESPSAPTSAVEYRRDSSSDDMVIRSGIQVKKIASGTFKCPVKGCPSKHAYKRSEHLKRHYKSKHDPGCVFTDCPYCESPRKTFDRFDNFKQHIELHTRKDRQGSRVRHVPEAELLLAELNKNIKPRRTKGKSKAAPSA